MKNEFVPYEIALALKELGFDEPCFAVYNDPDFKWARHLKGWEDNELDNVINSIYAEGGFVTAPLYQQAFRWFREEHDLVCFITPEGSIKNRCYLYSIKDYKAFVGTFGQTYEEAELECLKKLIEIVKQNTNLPEVDETIDSLRI